jgi:rare lipoprotein A
VRPATISGAIAATLLLQIASLGCATFGALEQKPWTETGIASYYVHGRLTANGERYDRYRMTAAHRSLPFGTRVRVTNVENQRSVVVRITDRGPYHKGRILDLSYAAGRKLGLVTPGTARVRLRVLSRGNGRA